MTRYALCLGLALSISCSRPSSEDNKMQASSSDEDIEGTIPFDKLEPQFRSTLGDSDLQVDSMGDLTITNPNMELRSMEWSKENPNYLTIVSMITMDVSENNISDLLSPILPGGISIPASILYSMDFNFEINSWEIKYDRKGGTWEAGDQTTEAALALMELFGPIISDSNFNENIEAAFESSVSKIVEGLPSDALEFVKDLDSGSVPESEFIKLLDKPKESLDFNGTLNAEDDALKYKVKVK